MTVFRGSRHPNNNFQGRKMFGISFKNISIAGVLTLTIAGCATSPDKITASYVSPTQYNSLNCIQIEEELVRVNTQVRTVAGIQEKEARGDAIAVGVGAGLLLWPAFFFVGDDDKERELAQLKGEYQALQQSASRKECGISDELSESN